MVRLLPRGWDETWAEIVAEFGYDLAADAAAAKVLARAPLQPIADAIHALAGGATVVGCGASLAQLDPDQLQPPIVCADGATKRLQELDVVPDVVVTDLDGDPDALAWAAKRCIMVVHAHGDNLARLEALDWGYMCGTHQATARVPGMERATFTDGDRAILLAALAGPVRLAAWDPHGPIGSYSHHFGANKRAKLAWAARIVDQAVQEGMVRLARR